MTKGSTVLRGGKLTFYLNGGRSPRETAAIYAHEFAHAADVKLKLSGRQDWDEDRRTDKEYIAKTAAHTTDDPREAFADFAAAAWLDAPEAKTEARQSWGLWRDWGLV